MASVTSIYPGVATQTTTVTSALQIALDSKVALTALNGLVAAYLTTLPTTLPLTPGVLWNNGGVVCIS